MNADTQSLSKLPRHASEIFQRVTRYTKFVFVSKWALGAVSALIILTIIIIPLIDKTNDGARISFISSSKNSNGTDKPIMVKPRLQGVNNKEEPFTITADRAEQVDPAHVDLYNLQGDLFHANNSWTNIIAKQGFYNSETKLLTLVGDVVLYQDSGYTFNTQRVDIDTQKSTAIGDGAISGQGPLGKLDATGYSIDDNGAHMHFGSTGNRVNVKVLRK